MQAHSLLNSSSLAKPQLPMRFPAPDQTESCDVPVRHKQRSSVPRTTTGTFITPQSIMAFPFASSIVAGIWQAMTSLGLRDHNYIGFVISLFVGTVVYAITVSDPRLKMTRAERLAGVGIGLINCLYLFMAATAIHQIAHVTPH